MNTEILYVSSESVLHSLQDSEEHMWKELNLILLSNFLNPKYESVKTGVLHHNHGCRMSLSSELIFITYS